MINWFRQKMKRFKGRGISILVPFHCSDHGHQRVKNWHWLKEYWECHLPGAEIIMGEDPFLELHPEWPFSKSVAVNNAASKAMGDIFVIVDADGYFSSDAVLKAAHEIRAARRRGHRLWFVPYRHFFRLTEDASKRLMATPPCHPLQFPKPPDPDDIQNTSGSQAGHWFGAGIQIMPREAFEEVGGWDPRFRGWGGEDHSAMRAMDTLFSRHKTLPEQFLHVWHPMLCPTGSKNWVEWNSRMWANQTDCGANNRLSGRYFEAYGDYRRMRNLLNEGLEFGRAMLKELRWELKRLIERERRIEREIDHELRDE